MANFDAAAATAAYLAQLPLAAHAKALAYTHGGHWLLLWGWLVGLASSLIVLKSGALPWAARRLQTRRPRPTLVSFVLAAMFFVATWVIELPWSAYAGWWREKAYGLTSQSFGGWLGEGLLDLAISALLGALFLMGLYALMRRSPRRWWLWGSGLAVVAITAMTIAGPLLIEPLFNTYTPAPPGPVRDAVAALARESGVPSDKIYVYNGSKQSNRYTANVSGLFGSARVAMSDTMFTQGADLAEVRGVVGHEMGHYARGHVLWATLADSLLAIVLFGLADRLYPLVQRWTAAGTVDGIADPAGLPLLVIVLSTLLLLATPLTNGLTRAEEADADAFSLRHAREPDGLSKALVKTIAYRAATPGRLEETLFYDHPSVGRRIRRAMDWKAAHLPPSPGAR